MQRVSVTMPSVSIKVIIGVHFILTTWATLYPTLPTSYVFSNFLVLFMGIWALVETERTDPVVMFLLGLIFTIISDIVALSIYYVNLDNSTYRFAIGMAIMSLILKLAARRSVTQSPSWMRKMIFPLPQDHILLCSLCPAFAYFWISGTVEGK
ncbi:type-1 angiotensin II receptor-associated protein isoform X1 [Nematostella vectensis]|uniref:type-1 angiotensin II receptor-associated protein isoform X1 n=1 Tax=Nematostella vectensis TaxID=45351 RepID=UPI00139014EA|nr:type-1 angiotensin II receptor-associated protein isoform X1 [Nematostella vectensis]